MVLLAAIFWVCIVLCFSVAFGISDEIEENANKKKCDLIIEQMKMEHRRAKTELRRARNKTEKK